MSIKQSCHWVNAVVEPSIDAALQVLGSDVIKGADILTGCYQFLLAFVIEQLDHHSCSHAISKYCPCHEHWVQP